MTDEPLTRPATKEEADAYFEHFDPKNPPPGPIPEYPPSREADEARWAQGPVIILKGPDENL